MSSGESSAIQVLKRAVELDSEQKFSQSLPCYEQGIRLLLQAAQDIQDAKKKEHYKKKVEEYLARAEKLKELIKEEDKKKQHVQVNISKGATGYGYYKVFGPYLSDKVTEAAIKDPYIRTVSQLFNLQRFCEMLFSEAPNLKRIYLVTSSDPHKRRECETQKEGLAELAQVLSARNINFSYKMSESLHDREIRFNNGWTVQLGRGLSYFQPLQGGKFDIGSGNYDLRPCHETTIDIFHKSSVNDVS